MLTYLLDFFFPRHSLKGEEGSWITPDERRTLRSSPVRLHRKLLRQRGNTHLDGIIAAGSYSNTLMQKAIRTFKYGRIPELRHELADLIVESLPGLLLPDKHDAHSSDNSQCSFFHSPFNTSVLCPVPLHWTRKFERGFNQAEMLAYDLAISLHWPMDHLLTRTRPTGHQAWRTKEERMTALEDAFAYIGPTPPPQRVFLVDDLATTGATLNECAKTLKKAGVKRVEALVVAHG